MCLFTRSVSSLQDSPSFFIPLHGLAPVAITCCPFGTESHSLTETGRSLNHGLSQQDSYGKMCDVKTGASGWYAYCIESAGRFVRQLLQTVQQ
jgi:hypothetical protein